MPKLRAAPVFILECSFVSRSVDNEIPSPLGVAAETGHLQVMQLLVQAGAKKNQPGPEGRTPLWCAAASRHLLCVRWLLGHSQQMSGEVTSRLGNSINHSDFMNLVTQDDRRFSKHLKTRCPGFCGKKLTQSWEIWRE
jgi:ankyrin repeat protein